MSMWMRYCCEKIYPHLANNSAETKSLLPIDSHMALAAVFCWSGDFTNPLIPFRQKYQTGHRECHLQDEIVPKALKIHSNTKSTDLTSSVFSMDTLSLTLWSRVSFSALGRQIDIHGVLNFLICVEQNRTHPLNKNHWRKYPFENRKILFFVFASTLPHIHTQKKHSAPVGNDIQVVLTNKFTFPKPFLR